MSFFQFSILKKSKNSNARSGIIKTPNGIIETPCFVPVATNATIKSCTSEQINEIGIDLMFCNTYHMSVYPGTDIVKNAGGLHKFMGRNKPIITDSGGFQIFSLMYGGVTEEIKSKGLKNKENTVLLLNEEGVFFRSYHDGKKIFLSPEISINFQKELGADIIIPLDELLPYHTEEEEFKNSFYRTHRWQLRSLEEHKKNIQNQAIYGVVHGGILSEYRKLSCEILSKNDFNGYAIGGSLGKSTSDVIFVLDSTVRYLSYEKPRHLLGIADLRTIEEAIKSGIDTFDSAYPTKCARHGFLFSDNGPIKIGQSKWKNFHEKISDAPYCKNYSASYLHSLYKKKEALYANLASLHNIWYLNNLCKKIRESI